MAPHARTGYVLTGGTSGTFDTLVVVRCPHERSMDTKGMVGLPEVTRLDDGTARVATVIGEAGVRTFAPNIRIRMSIA